MNKCDRTKIKQWLRMNVILITWISCTWLQLLVECESEMFPTDSLTLFFFFLTFDPYLMVLF